MEGFLAGTGGVEHPAAMDGGVPGEPLRLGVALGVVLGLAVGGVGLKGATAGLHGLGHRFGVRARRHGGVTQRAELGPQELGKLVALLR
ncbi:hypothetical protein ACQEVZ_23165 [Dactylosporangium sp. CA-152071]|uniref:hypothetical protein n=1 Tax=Dactylosporangium sp. CA-152071 TaxID=3239933 RepID=UPI003D8AE180